ncbi:DNA-binding protein [Actinoplanes sp. TBRC 11911]|nr:DNA-binding protein [Actinoplanes sp. TBRC 11911]
MGTAEITRRHGVSRQRAHQITNLPTFPKPLSSLQLGRIWAARDVEAWVAEHRRKTSSTDSRGHPLSQPGV